VDYICYCPPAGLQGALANLPVTLDETYTRTLMEIKEAKWKYAHRILQFVSVASRPLRVEEVAELFAFDFEAGSIPEFDEDCRPEDPADEVLSACSTLLSIVDGGYPLGDVMQFSHFSVKEFLTSTRLAKVTDTIPHRYHISDTCSYPRGTILFGHSTTPEQGCHHSGQSERFPSRRICCEALG
jgi:hypothetical protein